MRLEMKVGGVKAEQARLKLLSRVTGRAMLSLLKQEARALCVDAARMTGPKTLEKAEKGIDAEVARVYPSHQRGAGTIYKMLVEAGKEQVAKAYWRAMKQNRYAKADAILRREGVSMGLDEARYEAQRGAAGAVPKGTPMQGRATGGKQRSFAAKKKKRLGRAKAGWWVAAKALGGRVRTRLASGQLVEALPKWVRRHGRDRSLGSAEILATDDRAEITVENHVPHAFDAIGATRWQLAEEKADARMHKAIERSLEEIEKSMNRRSGSRGGRAA